MMLSVMMLSVMMLSVVMLNVVMLSVVAPYIHHIKWKLKKKTFLHLKKTSRSWERAGVDERCQWQEAGKSGVKIIQKFSSMLLVLLQNKLVLVSGSFPE
jgi:hypothetical protein